MLRPGTVSKILWHFTGGPLWDDSLQKQSSELKPMEAAYSALNSILLSNELRVGRYKELVRVVIPEKRVRVPVDGKDDEYRWEIKRNHEITVKSSPVCCVADIPLQHLQFHAKRYGKIAIGFYRESIVKAGFNPVMYTLEHSPLNNSIYQGFSALDDVNPWESQSELENFISQLEGEISNISEENNFDIEIDIDASSVESAHDSIEDGHTRLEEFFGNMLAYIKTFNINDFDSIYCEREWRSTSNFEFSIEDVAMIILPRDGDRNYFHEFIKETKLPRTIPVTCWEDLLEH